MLPMSEHRCLHSPHVHHHLLLPIDDTVSHTHAHQGPSMHKGQQQPHYINVTRKENGSRDHAHSAYTDQRFDDQFDQGNTFVPARKNQGPGSAAHQRHGHCHANNNRITTTDSSATEVIYSTAEFAATKPWFKGRMDARACELAVAGCLPGDYLVRQSASSNGYVLVVNDAHHAVNFPIRCTPNGDYSFANNAFSNLDQAVQYIRRQPLRSTHSKTRLALRNAACTAAWFAGGMGRKDGEAKVKSAGHGGFLVRLSSTRDKYNLVVNDTGTVCTFSIKVADDNQFVFGTDTYKAMEEVVQAMRVRCFRSVLTPKLSLSNSAL